MHNRISYDFAADDPLVIFISTREVAGPEVQVDTGEVITIAAH